jgi:hypothetical protein
MKTEEQIKAEYDKIMVLDQSGKLSPMAGIGAPFAAQALLWVLNDNTQAVSGVLPAVPDSFVGK